MRLTPCPHPAPKARVDELLKTPAASAVPADDIGFALFSRVLGMALKLDYTRDDAIAAVPEAYWQEGCDSGGLGRGSAREGMGGLCITFKALQRENDSKQHSY